MSLRVSNRGFYYQNTLILGEGDLSPNCPGHIGPYSSVLPTCGRSVSHTLKILQVGGPLYMIEIPAQIGLSGDHEVWWRHLTCKSDPDQWRPLKGTTGIRVQRSTPGEYSPTRAGAKWMLLRLTANSTVINTPTLIWRPYDCRAFLGKVNAL